MARKKKTDVAPEARPEQAAWDLSISEEEAIQGAISALVRKREALMADPQSNFARDVDRVNQALSFLQSAAERLGPSRTMAGKTPLVAGFPPRPRA